MSYVIDASVAAKWYFREHLHEESLLLLRICDRISAPDCIFYELCNVVKKKIGAGQAAPEQAKPIINHLLGVFKTTTSSSNLVEAAFKLSIQLSHSPYDCFYLADAIHNNSKLITADMEFFDKLRNSPWSASIMSLERLPHEHNSDTVEPCQISREKLDHVSSLSSKPVSYQGALKPLELSKIDNREFRCREEYISKFSSGEKAALLYVSFLGFFMRFERSRYEAMFHLFWAREIVNYVSDSYISSKANCVYLQDGLGVYEEYAKSVLNCDIIMS